MAANNIEFKIGSSFNGEGFAQANNAIKANQKELQSSIRGIGELTKALGEISPEAGRVASSVGNVAKAFVAGGIVGGVVQLAIQGIGEAVKYTVEMWNKADEIAKKFAETMRENLLAVVSDGNRRVRSLGDEMKDVTQQANALALAMNQATNDAARDQIYKVNVEKLQAITDDMSEEAKAVIEATAAMKISLIKADALITTTAENMSVTEAAYEAARKQRTEAEHAATDAKKMLAIAEQDSATTEEQLKPLREAVKVSSDSLAAAQKAVTAAELAHQKAVSANTAALQQREITLLESNEKIRAAEEREMNARNEIARKKEEEAEKFQKELEDAMWREKNARNGAAMKEEDAAASFQEYIDSLKAKNGMVPIDMENMHIETPVDTKVTNAKDIGSSASANINLEPIKKAIDLPRGLKPEVAERIRAGVANVADFEALNRYEGRARRDAENRLNRIKADTAKFEVMAQKPKSWLSDRDTQFMNLYKTQVLTQLPKDLAVRLLGSSAKHVMCKQDAYDVFTDSKVIKAWLGNLGLK